MIAEAFSLDSQSLPDLADTYRYIERPTNVETMIQKLFGGQLSIIYECLECTTESKNIEKFFELQFAFTSSAAQDRAGCSAMAMTETTQSLLNSLFETEEMFNND